MTFATSDVLLFAFILTTAVVFSYKVAEKPHMMLDRAIWCYVFAITMFFAGFPLTDVFAAIVKFLYAATLFFTIGEETNVGGSAPDPQFALALLPVIAPITHIAITVRV